MDIVSKARTWDRCFCARFKCFEITGISDFLYYLGRALIIWTWCPAISINIASSVIFFDLLNVISWCAFHKTWIAKSLRSLNCKPIFFTWQSLFHRIQVIICAYFYCIGYWYAWNNGWKTSIQHFTDIENKLGFKKDARHREWWHDLSNLEFVLKQNIPESLRVSPPMVAFQGTPRILLERTIVPIVL